MSITVGQLIEGEIETIAFGGEGILRLHNFVIFVPFTALGDHISCRITEVKRSFAKGELIQVQKPGPQRTSPICPHFGICGGCQLQHLNIQAQLTYKSNAVQESIKRIGHLSPPLFPIVSAPDNWAYRRHITLHLKPKGDGFIGGYIGQDNHSLIVINECPIFIEFEDSILQQIQLFIRNIPNPAQQEGRLTVLKTPINQYILYFQFEKKTPTPLDLFEAALQEIPKLSGIIVKKPEEEFIIGNPYCEEKIEELTFRYSPKTFVQNHPRQSLNIYRHICQLAEGEKKHKILDLYCGFGITSLLLAKKGHSVKGIECNPEAIRFAQENAIFNNLKNTDFIQGDVEKALPNLLKKRETSFIIVNPPRQGLTIKVIQQLLESSCESIIYVSCKPATLARDLNLLCEKYAIKEGKVYDMFPQTAHVETLVHLQRKENLLINRPLHA